MCSGYEAPSVQKIADLCGGRRPEFEYAAEIYPGRDAPIIVRNERGELTPVRAGFGMIPQWAALTHARKTYNARSETVHKLPSFREAWRLKQTCLVPVQTFYEPSYETGKPVRHAIGRKDHQLTMLAGLWEIKREKDGTERRTFTMLTINATDHPLMSRFHGPEDEKRSVVAVEDTDWAFWLAPVSHDEMRKLLRLFDSEKFYAVPRPIPPRAKKSR